MKRYTFEIGNSTSGQIGAVIQVTAISEQQAVERANFLVDSSFGDYCTMEVMANRNEYFTVYLNGTRELTLKEITSIEPIAE